MIRLFWLGMLRVPRIEGNATHFDINDTVRSERHVIAVEPLASRRALATQFGATHAVTPQEAPAAVFQVAPKGADLVLEMVGHNQETRFPQPSQNLAVGQK